MVSINKLISEIKAQKPRGVWSQGVKVYALELLAKAKEYYGGAFELNTVNYKKILLNGASDWKQYSEGGCALIWDGDIAKRLCNKSELVKTRNGERRPNAREEWIDVQSRALYQAGNLIYEAIRGY